MWEIALAILVYLALMIWQPDIGSVDRAQLTLLVWLGMNQIEIFLHIKDIKDVIKSGLMVKVRLKDLQNLVKED